MSAEFLIAPGFGATHGFFTRRGGVSTGPYASLNCSLSGGDDIGVVTCNRALVAAAMDVDPMRLVGVTQVHGDVVVQVAEPGVAGLWGAGQGPRADAMVTDQPGMALGIITADCAPVLLWDGARNIVGAVHAGWRGAACGVLEAVVTEMVRLGSDPAGIVAAVGPCIAQASYEVGQDLYEAVLPSLPGAGSLFRLGVRPDRWMFDLAGYCLARLAAAGVPATALGVDTCADEARFFSHRRRILTTGGPIGHQISVIRTHG